MINQGACLDLLRLAARRLQKGRYRVYTASIPDNAYFAVAAFGTDASLIEDIARQFGLVFDGVNRMLTEALQFYQHYYSYEWLPPSQRICRPLT